VRVVAERVYLSSSVKAKREFNLAVSIESGEAAEGSPTLNDEVDEVLGVLVRLPYWQRKVMAWYYDGYSIREIADLTGKPESTIRSHLRHARDRLRLAITDQGRGESPTGGGLR
jgi:DNA-directed RNA polymerase specialized sigma24 family protein